MKEIDRKLPFKGDGNVIKKRKIIQGKKMIVSTRMCLTMKKLKIKNLDFSSAYI